MNLPAPLLTVIIPVFNEAKTIRTIIDRVRQVEIDKEIIVVDDFSEDDTLKILDSLDQHRLKILKHTKNKGKGAAIQTAIPEIEGSYVIIQDGDLEYNPQDFIKILNKAQSENALVVYGSRILSHSRMSYLRYWLGGRGVTWFTNLIFRSNLTDEPTCYKLFDSELFKSLNIKSSGFEFCPEVTAKVLQRKIPILEVPISYDPRSIEEGKKIRWRDGFIALWILLKYRFPRLLNR